MASKNADSVGLNFLLVLHISSTFRGYDDFTTRGKRKLQKGLAIFSPPLLVKRTTKAEVFDGHTD